MLNKENYTNDSEPGDINREVPVLETFHVQTDDELTEKKLKQIEAVDQAIQTILLGLPEDIYAAVDSCETAQEIWLRPKWCRHVIIVHQTKDLHTADYTQLYDFLKYNQKEVDELKVELLAKIQYPLALMANSNKPYAFPAPHQDQPSYSQNYMQQPMPNPEDITDPTTVMNMALALMAKAFKLNYSTPTNNNQRISSNPRNRQIAQPGMNMCQDRKMQMVGGNGENQFRQYTGQNVGNLNGYNAVQNVGNQVAQNPIVHNVGNQNGLNGVPGYTNLNGNSNLVAARAKGNVAGHNENHIRCYNFRGVGHFARNCTNDNNVISEVTDVEQGGEIVEHHSTNFEETRALYDSLYQNLAIEVEKANSEADKFVGDFKSLAKEADESLAKHKALELEIKRLLRAVVSQDIMSVVQKESVVDTSNLQTELEPYKDMQQNIKRLQAQLGDLKGKSKDTSCVSDTLNPLSQKLENENVELEFQNTIYENTKLRAQLFKKVSGQKDNKHGKSTNTKFAKQSILGKPPKVGEIHALSKPVTSNSIPTPQDSKVVKNDKVIAREIFRINPFKTSREEKHVPNNVRASTRTKPITISQPSVITKKDVNSDSNCLSSTGIDNTKTRKPQPRSNTKNDRVPSTSKSSRSKNKGGEVEEHHRNLLLFKNMKHILSACNNFKLDSQNVYSKVVCAMSRAGGIYPGTLPLD
nr:hypothetical protein [Tanacetum cinerariifolium]